MSPVATIDPALLDAPTLVPSDQSQVLDPTTPVVIVHRGGPDIVEKFDGREYVVPAGRWTLPYGVAMHLKTRAIVPGSRNPHTGKTASRIGIVATTYGKPVDPPEKCRLFTADELAKFGDTVEALDRSVIESPGGRRMELVGTTDVIASVQAHGIDVDGKLDAGIDPAALAPTPAGQNSILQQASADAIAGGGDPIGRRRR